MKNSNILEENNFTAEIKDGKHLIFELEQRSYGMPVMEVSEVNKLIKITHTPNTPGFVKGIINLRGRIIPVLDLRLKFGMSEKEYDSETCIIIVNAWTGEVKRHMGIIVDKVSEVYDIPVSEIDPPPDYGTRLEDSIFTGIGKIKGKLVMLINLKKLLYSEKIVKVDEIGVENGLD